MNCSICLENEIKFVLIPCGHSFCEICCSKIEETCPYCKQNIKLKNQLFLNADPSNQSNSLPFVNLIYKSTLESVIKSEVQVNEFNQILEIKLRDIENQFKFSKKHVESIANDLVEKINLQKEEILNKIQNCKEKSLEKVKNLKLYKDIKENEFMNLKMNFLKLNSDNSRDLQKIEKQIKDFNIRKETNNLLNLTVRYGLREFDNKIKIAQLINDEQFLALISNNKNTDLKIICPDCKTNFPNSNCFSCKIVKSK